METLGLSKSFGKFKLKKYNLEPKYLLFIQNIKFGLDYTN